MRVYKEGPPEFISFSLRINVETVEEAQALYAIFNKCSNTRLLDHHHAESVRAAIGREYYVSEDDKVIANGITYAEFYPK